MYLTVDGAESHCRTHFAFNNTLLDSNGVTADIFISVATTTTPNIKCDLYLVAFKNAHRF
jgi:hypothetical protein